jgi:transcriptional regulator with XRE-family HTH domain
MSESHLVEPTLQIKQSEQDLRDFVGENIALARTALGKRQVDWVREYPQFLTSRGKLANYENGDRFPSPLFLVQLCKDYGLSMDWFYRRDAAGVSERLAQLLRKPTPSR